MDFWEAYGLMGSLNVSSMSSILEVCSRMASSGLGSAGPSLCAPPKGFWLPRWYPAVPLICAMVSRDWGDESV